MAADETTKPDESPDIARELAAAMQEGNRELIEALRSNNQPETPVDTGPSLEDLQAKAAEARTEARKKYAELQSEGRYEEAALAYEEGLEKAQAILSTQRSTNTDPSNDAAFQSFVDTKLALAEMKDKEGLFERYGDEIRDELNKLSPQERITDAGIKKALKSVKTSHFDEILEARVNERVKSPTGPPGNAPDHRLGESEDTDLHNLTPEQREAASVMGVSYKDYAEQVAAEDTRSHRPFTHDGQSVEILPKLDNRKPNSGVKRGGF